ncbi:MAG TPA: GNAT family N-acetyltransferase [Micromonosporaceae bacterium]|jgi:GNAT superfamily N-acetyltransferase
MDLTVRPYRDSDVDSLLACDHAVDGRFGAHPGLTAEDVRIWVRRMHDPETDSRVVIAPDGSVVAYGLVGLPSDGGVRCGVFGEVHPRWIGRGIGRDLLAWQLRRARDLRDEVAPGSPWTLWSGCYADDADTLRLHERFGLQPARYWFSMAASTAKRADVPMPDGFRLTDGGSVDPHRLYVAHMEAFQDHFGFERESFDEFMRDYIGSEAYRPELSRIAYDGDEIAAYVICYDEADPKTVLVGDVGTRSAWRRRGLASALLSDVLAAADAAGRPDARLNVDASSAVGAVGVYERAGFAVESRRVSVTIALDAL